MKKRVVTLKDIALEVGLSVNSVSRALKDSKEISESTRKRVKDVADRLGYVPNLNASSLRQGQSKVIALVFDNMTNTYYGILAEKIQDYLKPHEYDIMIFYSFNCVLDDALIRKISSRYVDAIITFVEPTNSAVNLCKTMDLPVVLVGRQMDDMLVDMLVTDDYRGGYIAGQTLVDAGCKNIGFVGNDIKVECCQRRIEGLRQCLIDNNIPFNDSNLVGIYQPINENFEKNLGQYDGLFCFNDMIAYEIYILAGTKVKIVGYDDIQKYIYHVSLITSVSSDKDNIAKSAVFRILDRLRDNSIKPEKLEFPSFMSYGRSCPKNE